MIDFKHKLKNRLFKILYIFCLQCKTKSIETYEQVYEDITNHAKSILKNIEAESKFILNRCKNDVEVLKNKKEAQLQEFSHSVKERLDKLSILDPSAASLKRKCALSLNYQVRQAFTNAQCDIVPKIEKIKQTLKILERDVLICIDRAKTLVALCRKCNNPQRLDKCIEENTETAKQILNDAHKSVQVRLNKIEALRQETLQYHTATTAEVTAIYSKKYKTFLKHLDKCIFTIKNINKQ
ncbi:uncharacterized protein LOC143185913 [Calliopsis andreniformis]|uniref:uncharacterized protein LOC143185913 n=1 Tax=Calliopsis andreniformis TaxID=337506 RepID=UPI003FCEAD14